MMEQTTRINLWSGPRNVSTALMYSFAQRADTRVVDEPLYAYYLQRSGADHPGRAEILASQATDGEEVVREVMLGAYDRPVVFFKQMAHHLEGLNTAFRDQMRHVLLIRHPAPIIRSYAKVIPNPSLEDLGFPQLVKLHDQLKQAGRLDAVLDSRQLLLNPPAVLRQLCEALDLPFDPAVLQWEAGARPEDGVWAPHWYSNVHRSTGFKPYEEEEVQVSDQLQHVLDAALPLYEHLFESAIRAPKNA